MARKRIPDYPRGRNRPLYPNGWPKNLIPTLYLNSKAGGSTVPAVIGQPLQAETQIYETTEMSNYG